MIFAVQTKLRSRRIPRFHRLVRLFLMIQEQRFFSSCQLQDQLRVSQRTIFRDLAALQDAGVILVYNPSQREYQFTGVDLNR